MSEAFRESERILRALDALTPEQFDGPEGDALRDASDQPWRDMTEPERDALRTLAMRLEREREVNR